jgi:NAD(P)-dependent dehydrogenase (short-subunit alcohol dehydrogenase family)
MTAGSTNDLTRTLPEAERVRQMHDLSGKVALVTGAASGIGRAMAWGLASHGADIAIVDRDGDNAAACAEMISCGTGRRAISVVADVAAERDVVHAAAAAEAALGDIDILVNNAGHNIRRPLVEFTLAEFDSLYAVHVRGAFLFCRALGARMQARRSGSIINIASMLGQVGALGVSPYAAAKAGLAQLSRVLALEMAPHRVRVNAIAPGYIDTPLTRQHAPEVRERIIGSTPLGRFGGVTELMGPVVFLASEASSFVTGMTLVVDGGWTAQ